MRPQVLNFPYPHKEPQTYDVQGEVQFIKIKMFSDGEGSYTTMQTSKYPLCFSMAKIKKITYIVNNLYMSYVIYNTRVSKSLSNLNWKFLIPNPSQKVPIDRIVVVSFILSIFLCASGLLLGRPRGDVVCNSDVLIQEDGGRGVEIAGMISERRMFMIPNQCNRL